MNIKKQAICTSIWWFKLQYTGITHIF